MNQEEQETNNMDEKEINTIDNVVSNTKEEEVNRKKMESCTAEINVILKKYECNLDAGIFLRAGQIIPSIRVVILDKTNTQQPI